MCGKEVARLYNQQKQVSVVGLLILLALPMQVDQAATLGLSARILQYSNHLYRIHEEEGKPWAQVHWNLCT